MKLRNILFIILFCNASAASAYDDALVAAATAAFKQSGGEKMMDKFIKDNVPKDVREFVGKLTPIITATVNGKVEFKWTF